MSTILILGFILIALGIVMALPFFGVGMIIPALGDVIDIPISFVLLVVGTSMIVLGGLAEFFIEYWWLLILIPALWLIFIYFKIKVSGKRRRRRK